MRRNATRQQTQLSTIKGKDPREVIMASVPFDQLDGHIWMNGEFVKWADAKIHVLTHGLHYASAVFEGARIRAGARCARSA